MAGQLISVAALVDTTTILGNPGAPSNQVIFMADNNAGGGSSGEGTNELNTACGPADVIVWRVVAINGTDQVVINGFKNSTGDVFGFNTPQPTNPPNPSLMGTVQSAGNETYQLEILINGTTTYSWDPFLTSTGTAAFNAAKAHAAKR